jgi:hypothetical protein
MLTDKEQFHVGQYLVFITEGLKNQFGFMNSRFPRINSNTIEFTCVFPGNHFGVEVQIPIVRVTPRTKGSNRGLYKLITGEATVHWGSSEMTTQMLGAWIHLLKDIDRVLLQVSLLSDSLWLEEEKTDEAN